ncbi:hypothetical protein [Pseudomonas sp. RL]|uniref:hypothetical protein n=1 Tax=Pseudomonas sp. RL TaxID=1452718 RepID=UPI00210A671F|nr:hypothetical protein [Pseudomonas sp. RL]
MDVSTDNRPIVVRGSMDKVLEHELSRLIGYPEGSRALERKRQRGIIPAGVYAVIDGRIIYSIRRYDEWVESLWPCPQALNSLAPASESASCGTESADAKPSRTRKPRKASKRPLVYALQ